MQCFNPFDEDHLSVVVLAIPQFGADGVDQLVQVEEQSFVKRPENHIFEKVVYFFGVLLDVMGHCGLNQADDPVEDIKEVLGTKYGFFAGFDDVEHAVAGGQLHLLILVIETPDNWGEEFVEEASLLFLVQGHCNYRQAVETLPPPLRIISFGLVVVLSSLL